MTDFATLRKKADELAARDWDVSAIEARIRKLTSGGIPRKKLVPEEMLAGKQEILERVQLRAEEYNFVLKNCAQGTALSLMEEFGLGSMDIIQALAPFPGIGGTGEVCGGIIGSLIVFGLYFSSDDPLNYNAMSNSIMLAQKFMFSFENEVGHMYCSNIIETVIIGQRLNPGENEEAMVSFTNKKGFERCGLATGIGVRLAAEFIIDSMKQS